MLEVSRNGIGSREQGGLDEHRPNMDSACRSKRLSPRTSLLLDGLIGVDPFAPKRWVDRNYATNVVDCPTSLSTADAECEDVVACAIEDGDLDLAIGWNGCDRLPWT